MQETANPIALRYRRMILDAFAALTRTTPYGEITILRIVQEADVSRQTFYRHFRSKDEILAAMLQRIADGVTERLQSLQQPTRREIFATYLSFWRENADFLRIVYGEIMREKLDILRPHFAALSEREFDLMKSFLIGGLYQLKADWYAQGFEEEPDFLAALLDKTLA